MYALFKVCSSLYVKRIPDAANFSQRYWDKGYAARRCRSLISILHCVSFIDIKIVVHFRSCVCAKSYYRTGNFYETA